MNELQRNSFSDGVRLAAKSRIPGGWPTVGIAAVLIVLALVIWYFERTSSAEKAGFGAGGPVPVGIAVVDQGDIKIALNGLGAVTPLATETVRPQVTGTLEKIYFTEGQMVAAGQLLAQIDPRPFQAALDQAKGQLARDESALANAKIDLGRYQSLWKQAAVSQQILQTQIATVGTDEGTVKADKAAVEAAAVNLAYCRITSPISGRAGLRQVDAGNLVQAGGTSEIVVITQLEPISVLFTLPEDDISQIMGRVRSGASLPVAVYDRSQTALLANGTLSNIDNEIDPTTGTVKMRAMFDNKDNALFPNQFVNVHLLVDTLHNQTRVPAAAIQRGASGTYVYVIDKELTANMRAVTTGPTDGDMVAITRGLSGGEKVVVDGADRLKDGASVLLPGMKPSATPQASPSSAQAATTAAHNGKWNGKHRRGHHHRQGGGSGP